MIMPWCRRARTEKLWMLLPDLCFIVHRLNKSLMMISTPVINNILPMHHYFIIPFCYMQFSGKGYQCIHFLYYYLFFTMQSMDSVVAQYIMSSEPEVDWCWELSVTSFILQFICFTFTTWSSFLFCCHALLFLGYTSIPCKFGLFCCFSNNVFCESVRFS